MDREKSLGRLKPQAGFKVEKVGVCVAEVQKDAKANATAIATVAICARFSYCCFIPLPILAQDYLVLA